MTPEEMESRLRTIHKASNSIGIPDHIFRNVVTLLSDVDEEMQPFEYEENILKAVRKHLLKTPCAEQEGILDFIRRNVVVTVDVEDLMAQLKTANYWLAAARAENAQLRKEESNGQNENAVSLVAGDRGKHEERM